MDLLTIHSPNYGRSPWHKFIMQHMTLENQHFHTLHKISWRLNGSVSDYLKSEIFLRLTDIHWIGCLGNFWNNRI